MLFFSILIIQEEKNCILDELEAFNVIFVPELSTTAAIEIPRFIRLFIINRTVGSMEFSQPFMISKLAKE